jgi:1-acyl-sn-glycerol-3-phosphate acyltransferase
VTEPRPRGSVTLPGSRGVAPTGRGVSWRTVPTFAAGVLATVAGAVLVWCRGAARAGSAVTDQIIRWWAGVWLRAAGARVASSGLEPLSAADPCVVVSNHQSSLDPIVQLRVLPVSLRVLAMRELFRIPLFGPALRAIGMIEVDRESPDFDEIDTDAARDLAAGHCLLAYPEGRISPEGAIEEFKDGAFIIAVTTTGAGRAGRHPWHRPDLAAGAEGDPRRRCAWWPGARCRRAA